MNVTVTFRGLKPSPAIRDYLEEKAQKFGKYLRDPIDVKAVCEVEKFRHKIDMTIQSHRDHFQGQEIADDMYISIDRLLDALETQMRRNKDKKISRSRKKEKDVIEVVG